MEMDRSTTKVGLLLPVCLVDNFKLQFFLDFLFFFSPSAEFVQMMTAK